MLSNFRFSAVFFFSILLSGCTSIQLISFHDEETERLATEIQKDVSTFLVNYQALQTDEERSFAAHQEFYKNAAIKTRSLSVRASAIYKNEITSEQVRLLEQNFAYQALLHKNCVTGALSADQIEKVRTSGIDVSLGCNSAFGASIDTADNGSNVLSNAFIPVLQSQFDQTLGAIIRLELAKRRGETEE